MLQIYYADLEKIKEEQFQKMFFLLSDERKEKALQQKTKQARNQRIAAGFLLEEALKKEQILPPYHYGKTKNGKPYLNCEQPLFFSVSHSKNAVYTAISQKPVGIDVEVYNRKQNADSHIRIARRFFSENERKFMEKNQDTGFYFIWTYKECMAKILDKPLYEVLLQNEYPHMPFYMKQWESDRSVVTVCAEVPVLSDAIQEWQEFSVNN